jgi:hypothetical protein
MAYACRRDEEPALGCAFFLLAHPSPCTSSHLVQLSKAPCRGCHDLSAQAAKAQQLQEDAIRMKDKAEKLLAKAKAAPAAAAPKTSREQQLQSEVDKCMSILKCSTCKMRMRNTVITKCMHCESPLSVAVCAWLTGYS